MMNRRKFLSQSSKAIALPLLLNGLPISAITKSALFNEVNADSDRVLVLIQLNGGNDGLNMLIPLDQYDNLALVRENIIIPENNLLSIEDNAAFHPSMTALKNLYDNEGLGIIQSVGYPDQNRSHFRSKDIWMTGSPSDENWTTGWLGRYMDDLHPTFPTAYPNEEYPDPFAIAMGANQVSSTCQGSQASYCLAMKDPNSLGQVIEGTTSTPPNTPYGNELAFLRTTIAQSNAYSETIETAAELGNNIATYPEGNSLAEQLKNVALLISGGLDTKIYIVDLGGFDTHADQVVEDEPEAGEHAVLLETLSEAISAFTADLEALGLEDRVMGMTFSEFGRRIRSNGSLGTDHGTSAPLMLFGACVKPQILGSSPEIDAEVAGSEGVPMQYDFRDVYGTILMDWFEVTEEKVKELLFDDFVKLSIFENCNSTSTHQPSIQTDLDVEVFPSPMTDLAHIRFYSPDAWVKVSVFNALGAQITVLTNKTIQAGQYHMTWNSHNAPSGVYFIRVQIGEVVKTKRVVKR